MRDRLTVMTVGVLLLVASCSGSGSEGPSASRTDVGSEDQGDLISGGSVSFALAGDPGDLDPWSSLSSANIGIAMFGYDTIVSLDADGQVVPALAESWTAEGDTWTFVLNPEATCADGSPVDPSLVAENVNYAADPDNGVVMAGVFLPQNASAVADDAAGTVAITLAEPAPFFLQGLYGFPIICRAGLDDRSTMRGATQGSGPYVLDEAAPGDSYTYTMRDDYTWGPGGSRTGEPGQPETVTLRVVENETTVANMLLGDQLNIGSVVGPDVARLEEAAMFHADVLSPAGQMFFNQREGMLLADEELRRALTMAIDRSELNSVFSGGRGQEPEQLQVFAITCPTASVAENLPGHDVDGARALLDEIGWVTGSDGLRAKDGQQLTVALKYDAGSPQIQSAAELAVARWKEIGVEVNAEATDVIGSALFGELEWDIAWQGVGTLNPAALVPFFSGPTPPDGNNFSGTTNPEYDALTAEGMTLPAEEGCQYWNDAEASLLRQVNLVPFSYAVVPTYGNGVTFAISAGQVQPLSIRQHR
ncbi:ABC transporter substrate-binding protein [Phytoactinopolyspora limicola]|uniref:ABC transporter substrate-binding protein n=1 Tax=Phytoactinopolyspora limicola TaxID=2715536 RepID=UPI00140B1ED0|nr:ABC transporter substrate-binding protein [Phytoactinopolyspora limicola]